MCGTAALESHGKKGNESKTERKYVWHSGTDPRCLYTFWLDGFVVGTWQSRASDHNETCTGLDDGRIIKAITKKEFNLGEKVKSWIFVDFLFQ